MAMTAVMRRMAVDAVPHGFRSTFRDWARERTNFPPDIAEQSLAHTLDNKVEAAYRRGHALEKQRELMSSWTKFYKPVIDVSDTKSEIDWLAAFMNKR